LEGRWPGGLGLGERSSGGGDIEKDGIDRKMAKWKCAALSSKKKNFCINVHLESRLVGAE